MNKNIVITGVSKGLGKKITEVLSSMGYRIYGLTRNINGLTNIFNENVTIMECDISDKESVINTFSKINRIDVLINNASIFLSKKFKDVTYEEIDDIINTNLKGNMYCTLESIKKLNKNGRIINIGSVSGTHGISNQSIYSASKFGVNGFAESLGQELSDINITTINPGGINTPLWNDNNKYNGNVGDLLSTEDITETIINILNMKNNVVVKEIILFPKCEWH